MMNNRFAAYCLIMIFALCITAAAFAGPRDLVVVRPGGPGASEESQQQVARLIAEIAAKAGWGEGCAKAYYFNKEKAALAHIQADKPGFLLGTPGFFLAYREELKLVPVNQVVIDGKSMSHYYVAARKGEVTSLDDLKGKTIAGSALAEPLFIERVVFGGKLVFGKDITAVKKRTLSALRKLAASEVDAVILDATEHGGLADLPFADQIETAYTSEAIPNTGIFSLEGVATKEDAEALAKATQGFCEGTEGASICETYGIGGFTEFTPGTFDGLIKAYDQKEPSK